MNGVWGPKDVGRVPLFDRLIDEEPERTREAVPLRALGAEGLRESIRRELARVLETRCPWPGDLALSRQRTALEYGLPDLDQGGRGLVSERRARLARLVTDTITCFEPRLDRVEVTVLDTGEARSRAVVSLSAVLLTPSGPEPISLDLPLGGGADAG